MQSPSSPTFKYGTPFPFCFIPEQTQPLLDNIFCGLCLVRTSGPGETGFYQEGILPNCFFLSQNGGPFFWLPRLEPPRGLDCFERGTFFGRGVYRSNPSHRRRPKDRRDPPPAASGPQAAPMGHLRWAIFVALFHFRSPPCMCLACYIGPNCMCCLRLHFSAKVVSVDHSDFFLEFRIALFLSSCSFFGFVLLILFPPRPFRDLGGGYFFFPPLFRDFPNRRISENQWGDFRTVGVRYCSGTGFFPTVNSSRH